MEIRFVHVEMLPFCGVGKLYYSYAAQGRDFDPDVRKEACFCLRNARTDAFP